VCQIPITIAFRTKTSSTKKDGQSFLALKRRAKVERKENAIVEEKMENEDLQ
jgi:hypothetical protein